MGGLELAFCMLAHTQQRKDKPGKGRYNPPGKTLKSNTGGVSFCRIGIQNAARYPQKYTPPYCFFCNFASIRNIYVFHCLFFFSKCKNISIIICIRLLVYTERNWWNYNTMFDIVVIIICIISFILCLRSFRRHYKLCKVN